MIRPPPRSTRTETLFPYTTLFRSHAGILDELNGLKRTLPELLQHAQMARLAAELGDHDRAAVERLSGVLGGGTLDYPSTLGSGHVSELAHAQAARIRSEERRVGKECVSTCRSRWSPYH